MSFTHTIGGYADNHPNSSEKSNFKIDWAVDSEGNPGRFTGCRFHKNLYGSEPIQRLVGRMFDRSNGCYRFTYRRMTMKK